MEDLVDAIKKRTIYNSQILENIPNPNDLKKEIIVSLEKNKDILIEKLNSNKYITSLKIITEIDYNMFFKLTQDDILEIQKEILDETGVSLVISNNGEYVIYEIRL